MHPLAATATPALATGDATAIATVILAAIGVLIALGTAYLAYCHASPFATCRRCHGTGRRRRAVLGVATCRRCKGAGARRRAGRTLINHLITTRNDTRPKNPRD